MKKIWRKQKPQLKDENWKKKIEKDMNDILKDKQMKEKDEIVVGSFLDISDIRGQRRKFRRIREKEEIEVVRLLNSWNYNEQRRLGRLIGEGDLVGNGSFFFKNFKHCRKKRLNRRTNEEDVEVGHFFV